VLPSQLRDFEALFFQWLTRVALAGVLAGCAWLDDAPPLDIAAVLISGYVLVRVTLEFAHFRETLPISNPLACAAAAMFAQLLLTLSFITIASFTERWATMLTN